MTTGETTTPSGSVEPDFPFDVRVPTARDSAPEVLIDDGHHDDVAVESNMTLEADERRHSSTAR